MTCNGHIMYQFHVYDIMIWYLYTEKRSGETLVSFLHRLALAKIFEPRKDIRPHWILTLFIYFKIFYYIFLQIYCHGETDVHTLPMRCWTYTDTKSTLWPQLGIVIKPFKLDEDSIRYIQGCIESEDSEGPLLWFNLRSGLILRNMQMDLLFW